MQAHQLREHLMCFSLKKSSETEYDRGMLDFARHHILSFALIQKRYYPRLNDIQKMFLSALISTDTPKRLGEHLSHVGHCWSTHFTTHTTHRDSYIVFISLQNGGYTDEPLLEQWERNFMNHSWQSQPWWANPRPRSMLTNGCVMVVVL